MFISVRDNPEWKRMRVALMLINEQVDGCYWKALGAGEALAGTLRRTFLVCFMVPPGIIKIQCGG